MKKSLQLGDAIVVDQVQRRRGLRSVPLAIALVILCAGCSTPAIRVAAVGDRALIASQPVQLVAETVAADQASKLVGSRVATSVAERAQPGALQLLLAATSRPEKTGICVELSDRPGQACTRWLVPPVQGWRPFGAMDVHQLTLRFVDPATGRVPYQVTASTRRRKPADAELQRRLLDAAIACADCAGGPLAKATP